jgi:hypothetical protein
MPTWCELDQQFQALSEPLRHHNLQYQWGAAGTHYHLSGGPASPASARFEVLARLAGSKLGELPDGVLHEPVLLDRPSIERWYEAIRYHSGAFEYNFSARQTDAAGNDLGGIYTGTVHRPASASAVLSLQFSQFDQRETQAHGGSINISQQGGVLAIGQQGNIHASQVVQVPAAAQRHANRWRSRWTVIASIVAAAAGIATVLEWFHIGPRAPSSPTVEAQSYNDDLHIVDFRHGPFDAGKAVNVNLHFRYSGSNPAHAYSPFGVDLLPLTPEEQGDTAKITGLVDSMWTSFLAQGLRGESLTIPPNTQRFASAWSRPLTGEQADNWNLRSTGLLIALGRIGWDDGVGAYETEYCVLVMASNPNVFVTCKDHNGPVTRRVKR